MIMIRVLILALFFVFLASCTNLSQNPMMPQGVSQTPYPKNYEQYINEANNQSGIEKQAGYIRAAGSLIRQENYSQASELLLKLQNLPSALYQEKLLLLAKINYFKGRVSLSLRQLKSINPSILSSSLSIYYYQLLAQVYHAKNMPLQSAEARIVLMSLLQDSGAKTRNQQKLWLSLNRLPKKQLCTVDENFPSLLRGWLSLACIAKTEEVNEESLYNKLVIWQKIYTTHPANDFFTEGLNSLKEKFKPNPQKIAMVVPLSGPLSGPGKALRTGFLARYYQSANKPKVKFYDSQEQSVSDAYYQAINNSADFIIGPLSKSNAQRINNKSSSVRTLLLNQLAAKSDNNFFQFGLPQVIEAKQVAYHMRELGLKRVLIIAPKADWAKELVLGFSQTFNANGGEVNGSLLYDNQTPFKQAIRKLLRVDESQYRHQSLRKLFRENIQFVAQRRQDVDAIFLLAYPDKARQIKPLLNYFYAYDLPVYATSMVYDGLPNTRKDKDLDGIRFCDMPFVFNQSAIHSQPSWPNAYNRYVRLYAMGMDSMVLSNQLNKLLVFANLGLPMKTGINFLNNKNQIVRELAWAKFENGRAVKFY